LVHGFLIDGTGASPVEDAAVLIAGDRIAAVGKAADLAIPEGVRAIDLHGAAILPGFINAHVHYGFSEQNLLTWAKNGVTTVRDEGTSTGQVDGLKTLQKKIAEDPAYARLVSAGAMMGVPGGYGNLLVNSIDEARAAVRDEIADGVSLIKVSQEDGYGGKHNLPRLTPEELSAIVAEAHARGLPVSGHITQGAYIQALLEAGVDDIAHVPYDTFPTEAIRWMVDKKVYLTPTFTVLRNFGADAQCVKNLSDFVSAGGLVALGNDFGGGPGDFEGGIPMYEIKQMNAAGMSPMDIIVASTKNAAHVSNIEKELGTLEAGKLADILVVKGDPLKDLATLEKVLLVIHGGEIIREEKN
jgi:imidazolonepropionase-like amidohydrolase